MKTFYVSYRPTVFILINTYLLWICEQHLGENSTTHISATNLQPPFLAPCDIAWTFATVYTSNFNILQTYFIWFLRHCTAYPHTARHRLRPRRVATAYPGQRPGVCTSNTAIWRLATDTVEVDLRYCNNVIEHNINDGQWQFGTVHIIIWHFKRRLPLSLRVTGAALAYYIANKPRSCQPHSTQRGHVQRASIIQNSTVQHSIRDYLLQPTQLAISISSILNSVYCPGIPHIYCYVTA